MAKELTTVRLILTSANSELDLSTLKAEYRVSDGDLRKLGVATVSGVDSVDTVTGMWDTIISTINTLEGIS